jgi:hypothetical protein
MIAVGASNLPPANLGMAPHGQALYGWPEMNLDQPGGAAAVGLRREPHSDTSASCRRSRPQTQ